MRSKYGSLVEQWMVSEHAARQSVRGEAARRWGSVTPTAIAGVSVNRVSFMTTDRFCTACLTVARAGAAGALNACEYTTNPRLDRYLQSNSKQSKTYKALYQSVNTYRHTRTFVTLSMTVIFTMVINHGSIPHNLFSWLHVPNPTSGPHTHTSGHNTPVLFSWAML